ncbi:MAG: hypothetical protein FWH38_03550 [Treponema sp.]|nr:hypothetical protein [Treponema sp.]
MVFEKCRDILLKESELVQRIACLQNLIKEAVISRDWTDFENHFSALKGMGEEFTALETERERLFSASPGEENGASGFYALAVQLPELQRGELTAIYRSLKLETLRVRIAGEALMSYISEARSTIAGFFNIAFPDRGGKIYTPHGTPFSHDMRSMILNRRF